LIGRGGGCSGLSCEDLRFTYDAKNVLDFSLKHSKSLGNFILKNWFYFF
jgi:hypothetical protein